MSFRDNLLHLRSTRNMTQEQLAMLVGVSRQSVTKWESDRSYPEMDKLLKLCQIFDCTLDELVQGDLTTRSPEPQLTLPATALAEDVIGYDEHHRNYALRMALGVSACIAAVACASVLDGFTGDGPVALVFFGGVALGLALIIPAAMEHSAFQKAHPYVTNFYTDEQRIVGKRAFGTQLAAGIAVMMMGLALGAFATQTSNVTWFEAGSLLAIAVGVGIIVRAALINSSMDIEEYNISALEELSEEEIAGIVGADRAPAVLDKVRRSKRTSAVCGVIMIAATAIALPLMFWATSYGDPFWIKFFWIPWMIGGLMCGIASIVIQARNK